MDEELSIMHGRIISDINQKFGILAPIETTKYNIEHINWWPYLVAKQIKL